MGKSETRMELLGDTVAATSAASRPSPPATDGDAIVGCAAAARCKRFVAHRFSGGGANCLFVVQAFSLPFAAWKGCTTTKRIRWVDHFSFTYSYQASPRRASHSARTTRVGPPAGR